MNADGTTSSPDEGTNGCRMNDPVDSVILVFTGAKGNEMIIVAVKK
jgi:hypothetical protein